MLFFVWYLFIASVCLHLILPLSKKQAFDSKKSNSKQNLSESCNSPCEPKFFGLCCFMLFHTFFVFWGNANIEVVQSLSTPKASATLLAEQLARMPSAPVVAVAWPMDLETRTLLAFHKGFLMFLFVFE